jgi:hypothetical protein
VTRPRFWWSRLVGATLVVAGGVVVLPGAHAARASAAAGRASASGLASGIETGPPTVALLGQTPWVEQSGIFRLRLEVTASDPSVDRLAVQAYTRLTTRTDFDDAKQGNMNGFVWYTAGPLSLSSLPADPAGGVDVAIPVNVAPPAGSVVPTLDATVGSGVYPLQIGVYDQNGVLQGQPLTTFLVYAAGPPSVTSLPRLSVALVLPFHSAPAVTRRGQLGPLGASESQRLSQLATVLSASPVPLSLDVTPQTLDALDAGSSTDQATAATLAGVVSTARDQVLPGPYVRASISDMEAQGLGGEVIQQLRAGSQTLDRVFGSAPSNSTWVVDGPVDDSIVSAALAAGAGRLVVPDSTLTALPTSVTETTFARPTGLTITGGPKLAVYGADPGITADFANGEPAVLAANQLLAELAMIQLETPGVTRGVAALPPPGWVPNPMFVATLLSGLRGHPLLGAVTVSSLFSQVPVAPLVRQLVSPAGGPSSPSTQSDSAGPLASSLGAAGSLDGDTIRSARLHVSGIAAIVPNDQALAATLQRQLLAAESIDVTKSQRQSLLDSITTAVGRLTAQISLPGSSSITLTSTRAQIPLTILSTASLKAHVQVQLSSQRLLFLAYDPPSGRCRVLPNPTAEVCDLILTSQNTTLKVPVEARSSGVFPLDVTLYSPGGADLLARDLDTVRSTAISGVGVVLIVLAVVSLGVWWVRDLRHGRRARRLVPAPMDPRIVTDTDPGAHSEATDPVSEDPVVNEFFAKPPPDYREPHHS